ncbi:very short patch repair endonuclease [Sagittula sp. MA-2]|uniref:very short patch repair endonuclease n=1 Tax=Sagittula sp. MA-2 TaxID=3048007 RepID=UPI0024C45EDD|nr:DNA mismatch endonuclease Vsr [Sagittula sp. MA-2]WHZ36521.1 DNA mismatch endonuclease Vsr [Sagittula sp. MA-2]
MAKAKSPMSRSENMSRIRSKDTAPELFVRRGLHARGFRFRVHRHDLPGRPDLVLTRWHAVIQVHGCYWHGHDCLGRASKTNTEYWGPKIARNRERDARNEAALRDAGWRVLIVWECCLKGPGRWAPDELLDRIADWVRGEDGFAELEGSRPA